MTRNAALISAAGLLGFLAAASFAVGWLMQAL
jgi:hypothetical protein